MRSCRGIRGATTCSQDTERDILEVTQELLEQLLAVNKLQADDIASAFFTATPDLTATFPARAARAMGLESVPLMGGQEMAVPNAPPRCIRVLLLVNTDRRQAELRHVYLRGAQELRPEHARGPAAP